MHNDKSQKPKSASEVQLDSFLRDMETESGVKKWAEGAYEEAKKSNNMSKSKGDKGAQLKRIL